MAIELTTASNTTITGIRDSLSAASITSIEQISLSSSIWNNTTSILQNNSANWENSESILIACSGSWNNSRTILNTNSGNWNFSYDTIQSKYGGWDFAAQQVTEKGEYWTSVYNTTLANSAVWSSDNGASKAFTDALTYLSTNSILISACTVTTNLSVGGTIFSNRLNTTGTGTPSISSGSDIILDAVTRVTVASTPLRVVNLTSTQRDNLAALFGDIIYNITTGKFQGFSSSGWVDLS